MDHGKKKYPAPRVASKKGIPVGWIITLALAGGAVLGWAGTYAHFRLLLAAKQPVPRVASATAPAQTVTMPTQNRYTPAPQPPGEAPPGKVWSVEHGHWHDDPAAALLSPAAAPATGTPAATTPAPAAGTPAATTPAPAAGTPAATTPAPEPVTPAAPTTPAPAVPKKE